MKRNLWAAILCAVLLASLSLPASARHCTKGKPCGDTCISRDKTCWVGEHGHAKAGRAPSPHQSHASAKHPRSKAAHDAFMRSHPCPANGHTSGACPGYVVDHIKPLKRGGADIPSNMQWQTIEEGKAKDKWE